LSGGIRLTSLEPTLVCTRCLEKYPEVLDRCPKDGAPLCDQDDIDRIGQTFGNYQFEKILGVGGMGVVYRGRHLTLEKLVAIKVLSGRNVRLKHATREILREAQAASRIHHPHIVDVTDFGTTPDGAAFLVMEYLEGESLNSELVRRGRLPVARAGSIARQVASALGAAHRVGIVHRDLKPENIFLLALGDAETVPAPPEGSDFVKVLDFGLAKGMDMEPSARTKAGLIAGTPAYMSPEQARGREIDGRSDIYSLGVLLYRMTTGVLPFKDEGAIETLMAHASAPIIPPRERCSAVDEEASALIVRCLQKSKQDRFQSMEELAEALRHLRPPGESSQPGLPAPVEPEPAPADTSPANGQRPAPVDKPTVTREIVDRRVFPSSLSEPEPRHLTPWPPAGVQSSPRVSIERPAPVENEPAESAPAPAAPASESPAAVSSPSPVTQISPAARRGPLRLAAISAAGLLALGVGALLVWPSLTGSHTGPTPPVVGHTPAPPDRGAPRADAAAAVAQAADAAVAPEPVPKKQHAVRPTGKKKKGQPAVSAEPKTEPKVEPKKVEPKPELKKVEPKKVEPKKVEPKKVEPKKVEPKPEPKKTAPPKPTPKKKIDIDWVQDPI
jgi:eukaryotic-like serine/threonine-protein kinase